MRRFSLIQTLSVLWIAYFLPTPASACPFCNSGTAQQVRSGIFNADFGYNLGVTLVPFVVLFALLILILCWPTAPFKPRALRRSSVPKPSTTK